MAGAGVVNVEVALQTMRGFPDTLALARWAEAEEVAALFAADHYLASPSHPYAVDQLTVMAAVAATTDRIQLGTLVSPVTFRHPAVMLKSAMTIAEICPGRFTLGVGAGWMEEEHRRFGLDFPPADERFARLEEALGYLRAGIDGNEAGFSGSFYRLAPGPPPEPRRPLHLVVGGSGARRTPRLAGAFADEFNLSAADDPVDLRIQRARRAAADAGRDPASLVISMAFPVIVGGDEGEVEARVAAVAARRGFDSDTIRSRWASLGIPIGTAPEYRARLDELADQGVQRVYLQVAFDPIDDVRRAVELIRG